MHVLHLGVCEHALGNLLADLCYEGFGKPKGQALLLLNEHIRSIQKGLEIAPDRRGPDLEYEHFAKTRSVYPSLSHGCWGASKVRALVPVGAKLGRLFQTAEIWTQHRTLMLEALAAMLDVVDRQVWYLSNDDLATLQSSTRAFSSHYSWLTKWAFTQGYCRYSEVPKFHYTCHIEDQAAWLAPRLCWCYGGESLVGRGAVMARSCTSGTSSHLLPGAFFQKYRVCMHLELSLGLTEV